MVDNRSNCCTGKIGKIVYWTLDFHTKSEACWVFGVDDGLWRQRLQPLWVSEGVSSTFKLQYSRVSTCSMLLQCMAMILWLCSGSIEHVVICSYCASPSDLVVNRNIWTVRSGPLPPVQDPAAYIRTREDTIGFHQVTRWRGRSNIVWLKSLHIELHYLIFFFGDEYAAGLNFKQN